MNTIKNAMISLMFSTSFLIQANPLPFYKETSHFKLLCLPEDQVAADELAQQSELFFEQLLHYLQHQYSTKITLQIYNDLASFHQAINHNDASDWVVGQIQEHANATITPYNPGPCHSYDSVIKANNVGLAELFIMDKYAHHDDIPRWLHQGFALYVAHYFSDKSIKKLKNNVDALPTFKQLEDINKDDNYTFNALNGFVISYSLVQFIDLYWGKAVLLSLLNDYADFENILKISKEEFEKKWIQFLCSL